MFASFYKLLTDCNLYIRVTTHTVGACRLARTGDTKPTPVCFCSIFFNALLTVFYTETTMMMTTNVHQHQDEWGSGCYISSPCPHTGTGALQHTCAHFSSISFPLWRAWPLHHQGVTSISLTFLGQQAAETKMAQTMQLASSGPFGMFFFSTIDYLLSN